MNERYEAPVLVLSMDTIRDLVCEESFRWMADNPDMLPEVLDNAAYTLSYLIPDHAVRDALEEAIASAME